jgi:hypothetical protein
VIGKTSAISGAPMTAVQNGPEKQSVRDLYSVTLTSLTCCFIEWHGPPFSARTGFVINRRPRPIAAAPAALNIPFNPWLPKHAFSSRAALNRGGSFLLLTRHTPSLLSRLPRHFVLFALDRSHDYDRPGRRIGRRRRRGRTDGGWGGCGRYATCDSVGGGGLGFSAATNGCAASLPNRSRSVTFASGAIANSPGCRCSPGSAPLSPCRQLYS